MQLLRVGMDAKDASLKEPPPCPRSELASAHSGSWTGAAMGEIFHQMNFVFPYIRDFGDLSTWSVESGICFCFRF